MLEKDIVKAIMKYLKTVPRCFAWKEHGGMYGTAGIPDIIACVDGRFYAFEVKTDSGKELEVKMLQKWPVRVGRPFAEKLPPREEFPLPF